MLDDRSKGVYNLNQPSTYLKMAEGWEYNHLPYKAA